MDEQDDKSLGWGCFSVVAGVGTLVLAIIVGLVLSIAMSPPASGPGDGSPICGTGNIEVPEKIKPAVRKAAEVGGLPEGYMAAMANVESSFDPTNWTDDSNGGTYGLWQLNQEEWSKFAPAGLPLRTSDPMIQADVTGRYLKARLETVRTMRAKNPDAAYAKIPELDALVIAHNAGEGNLQKYPRIPSITKAYLKKMATWFTPSTCDSGPPQPGGSGMFGKDDYLPFWNSKGHPDPGVDPWSFYWGECVSYTAFAVRTYTRHKDFVNNWKGAHFGNAKEWDEAARKTGIPVDQTPAPGAIVQHNRNSYGHVALITTVHPDGSFDINEYNHVKRHTFGTRKNLRMGKDFDNVLHFER